MSGLSKAQAERIRAQTRKDTYRSVRRAGENWDEMARHPDIFAARLTRDINTLSTNLRRMKRDKVAVAFTPVQRIELLAAAAKLERLLGGVPGQLSPAPLEAPEPLMLGGRP